MFDAAVELGEGKKYPMLFTVTKLVTPDEDAREFMASEERHEIVEADAFVIKSLPQRLIGNFYLRINRPPNPTKLFQDEDSAVDWLRTFVSEEHLLFLNQQPATEQQN